MLRQRPCDTTSAKGANDGKYKRNRRPRQQNATTKPIGGASDHRHRLARHIARQQRLGTAYQRQTTCRPTLARMAWPGLRGCPNGPPLGNIDIGAQKHELPAAFLCRRDHVFDPSVAVLLARVLEAVGSDAKQGVLRAQLGRQMRCTCS